VATTFTEVQDLIELGKEGESTADDGKLSGALPRADEVENEVALGV
jgi:hypothetical protein